MVRKIKPLHLAAVIFFTVSGGPYGLEPLLQYGGDHTSLFLLLVVPFLWGIPAILTVLELNGMMPVTGGYYIWVKAALGRRWAFYEGLWTWFYTFVDLAIYPVLFVQYASWLFPGLEAYKLLLCLMVVWSCGIINITGIVPVGKVSSFLGVLVLLPSLVLVILFLRHHALAFPQVSFSGTPFTSLGLAVYTVMWNFLGWDNITTYAEEVEDPIRNYLRSIFAAFTAIVVIYILVTIAAQYSGIDPAVLTRDGYPALGALLGGKWAGQLVAFGGMASALGLYSANLLSVSRVPKVMADDGLLPGLLSKVHSRFNTPYISIIVCSVVVSLMTLWSFADLIIIDVTIYGAGLFLEFWSLIRLRITAPDISRPFRIPMGMPGLIVLLLAPVATYVVALSGIFGSSGEALRPAFFAVAILLSAELCWQVVRWRERRR
jgi:amino acid transporter